MSRSDELAVVGVDLGGSTTRVVVVGSPSGQLLSRNCAGPANILTSDADSVRQTLSPCLAEALKDAGRPTVTAACVGAAGLMGHSADDVSGIVAALQDSGIRRWDIRPDVEVAFAAGTAEPNGTVIIAGTGAIAATIQDHRSVRTADGYGWLLGDRGSGHWLAVEATRALLILLDRGEPLDTPRQAWARHILGEPQRTVTAAAVVRASTAATSPRRASLARLVLQAALQQDALSSNLVQRAALHLRDSALEAGWENRTPLVLSGGLLGRGSPIASAFLATLEPEALRFVEFAVDNALGAAKLAGPELLSRGARRC